MSTCKVLPSDFKLTTCCKGGKLPFIEVDLKHKRTGYKFIDQKKRNIFDHEKEQT